MNNDDTEESPQDEVHCLEEELPREERETLDEFIRRSSLRLELERETLK